VNGGQVQPAPIRHAMICVTMPVARHSVISRDGARKRRIEPPIAQMEHAASRFGIAQEGFCAR